MCFAIPGKLLSAEDRHGLRVGRVQYGGMARSARLDFVPEASVGDYVLVHAGFAIRQVDEAEARRTQDVLRQMGAFDEELPPDEETASQTGPDCV